ncbi:MAG: hypothetical protein JWP34_3759, partial [Massilia sp.]|nr:hypothetical protein [Massilia sp.]
MTIDINLLLRAWSFDIYSEVLGALRFSNANPEEMLGGDEEEIRAGSIAGHELARKIFLGMAHKRTGIEAIDVKCEGPIFTEAEIATVPPGELDAFCDQLISGRLRADSTPSANGDAAQSFNGAAGLQGALLAVIDSDRAARARLAATTKKQMAAFAKQHSQTAAEIFRAAAGTNALTAAHDEIMRQQRLVDDAMGIVGKTGVAKVISDMQERDEIAKRAANHVARGGALQAMQEAARGSALAGSLDARKILGLDDLTAAQRIAAAHERAAFDIAAGLEERLPSTARQTEIDLSNFRPIDLPPNPAHK